MDNVEPHGTATRALAERQQTASIILRRSLGGVHQATAGPCQKVLGRLAISNLLLKGENFNRQWDFM